MCIANTERIYVNMPGTDKIRKWLRRHLEHLGALAVAVTLIYTRDFVTTQFVTERWDLNAYYSAVFDWSSIQAAFLFGVYAFFLSRSEPFIQAISGSKSFKLLRSYVVRTLYLSMTLTVLALPMVVAPVTMVEGSVTLGSAIFWCLSVLLTYTFLCFLKVIRVFGKIERRSQ